MKDFVKYGLEYWGSDDSGVSRCRRFMLEWQSFLHRYIPVGLLERVPHQMNERPPRFMGRNDLETLMGSSSVNDWIKISELLLGPIDSHFKFTPKHKASSYVMPKDILNKENVMINSLGELVSVSVPIQSLIQQRVAQNNGTMLGKRRRGDQL